MSDLLSNRSLLQKIISIISANLHYASINAIINKAAHGEFKDEHTLLKKLFQFAVLEEAFAGPDYDKKNCTICHLRNAEKILFKSSKFPMRDALRDIFEPLIELGYITDAKSCKGRSGCYKIIKTEDKIQDKPYLVKEIVDSLNLPKLFNPHTLQLKASLSTLNQIELNAEINYSLSTSNHLNNFLSTKDLQNIYNMSFIGSGQEKNKDESDTKILYLISAYTSSIPDMQIVNNLVFNNLKDTVKNNPQFTKQVNQCAELCAPLSRGKANVFQIVIKEDSKSFVIISTLVFSKEMRKIGRTNEFHLKKLYDYLKENWNLEIYFDKKPKSLEF